MKILLALAICVGGLTIPSRPWSAIKPGRSTCKDVEKILGGRACGKKSIYYETRSEIVTVQFAQKPCHELWPYEEYAFQAGTVTDVLVIPRSMLKQSDLHLDLGSFEKTSSGDMIDASDYVSAQLGTRVTLGKNGAVIGIHLFPGAEFENQRCFPRSKVTGDEASIYGASSILVGEYNPQHSPKESAALRGAADKLREMSGKATNQTRIYVISYGAPSSKPESAMRWAESARDSLTRAYNVALSQIVLVNGGYKAKPQVQLFVRPSGASAPKPQPTVYPPT